MEVKIKKMTEQINTGSKKERMKSLEELEYHNCHSHIDQEVKIKVGFQLANSFFLRGVRERERVAKFLDAWFTNECHEKLSQRLLSLIMEETNENIRNNLIAAAISTMPIEKMIHHLEIPTENRLCQDYELLVLIEAIERRLKNSMFNEKQIGELIPALKTARSFTSPHICRPFMWHLENILEKAKLLKDRLSRRSWSL